MAAGARGAAVSGSLWRKARSRCLYCRDCGSSCDHELVLSQNLLDELAGKFPCRETTLVERGNRLVPWFDRAWVYQCLPRRIRDCVVPTGASAGGWCASCVNGCDRCIDCRGPRRNDRVPVAEESAVYENIGHHRYPDRIRVIADGGKHCACSASGRLASDSCDSRLGLALLAWHMVWCVSHLGRFDLSVCRHGFRTWKLLSCRRDEKAPPLVHLAGTGEVYGRVITDPTECRIMR